MKTAGLLIVLVLFFGRAGAEELLSWQDCVKEAAKNHPDLISAQEAIKASEASKDISASSLYPQIDSSIAGSTAGTTTEAGGVKTKKTTDSYSYGLTGSQLIFDGSKTSNKVNAAKENIKASQYNYKFTSADVRQRLRSAYIDLFSAQELLGITEEIRSIRRSDFELITLRYESGIEHKGALLTARANLAGAELEIAQARRALEVAQRQLLKEMGRQQFSELRVAGDFTVTDTAREKPDFEALAKDHPNLGKLAAQTSAAFFNIKSTKADFLPSLSAQGGTSKSSSHWPPDDSQWNAGLTLSFPIFEGGLRLAQVDQATAVFNQARANERSARDGIILTLEQKWATLQDAVQTVGVQKDFLDAAQERANIAESQYSLGLIQFDNWTIIEDSLVSQKKAYLNSRINALLAEANWVQAKGETLEYAQ